MPSDPKPIVFISYAHADEPERPRGEEIQWYSLVRKFLRAGERRGFFDVWVDVEMMGGDDWEEKIREKLHSCSIFVLLVSADSMASSYILDTEIAMVRERLARREPLQFYPLLLSPTPMVGLADISDKNIRPRNLKPLSSYDDNGRREQLVEFANEIQRLAQPATGTNPSPRSEKGAPTFAAPKLVDISRLPETAYKTLVGREVELALLDAEFEDPSINILSLVAEGGAGKSALLNEWLRRLQTENYRGAESVLGWSFFSQGSNERATSADQFINWALEKLGVRLDTTSASAKGDAIAEQLMTRRLLLILDGVEPLQHGPGPQSGQLKDPGLRALLRRFAAAPPGAGHGLVVLTSRVAVADIQSFKRRSAPVVDIERLSDEAGAELLRENGVRGSEAELRSASRDFGGHPLALTLLASLIRETQNGDIRRRDYIRGVLADPDNLGHDHARRVMESYEKEWLAGQPVLLATMSLIGLFDRPASGDCLIALRASAIPGLTDVLVDLGEEQWRRSVARLREVRLLAPADPSDPEALDAHPLVREWFGDRLKRTDEAAWKAAHSRLYDHLRDTTREGQTPTLVDLAPLYHAIAHGCRAGRYQEALDEVYRNRICRRQPHGTIEFYSFSKLGAAGSDLAAISWFFDRPYEAPAAALTPPDRPWVLSVASVGLSAQARLQEALAALRTGLQMRQEIRDWTNAANTASRLTQTELLFGDVADAAAAAEKAVAFADQARDPSWIIINRAEKAATQLAAGQWEKAGALFADAERRHGEWQPEYPLLYSLRGYVYCDLLLSRGRAAEARDRAAQTLDIARQHLGLLDIGLDNLTIGRANLALVLQSLASGPSAESTNAHTRAATIRLDEAVERLRASGSNDYVPLGLLARAAFRRAIGDWEGARRDLYEAQEIAEPAPMRLYLCDIALQRARLALARSEAFAPLNGLVEPSLPPPAPPDPATAASLKDEARQQLDIARKLIADCGYHRRDEELAELDNVVAGGRRFADLPPRV